MMLTRLLPAPHNQAATASRMPELTRGSGFASFRIAAARLRAFLLGSLTALLVGVPVGAAARDGWFTRVCPAKTEANRIHLTFSGGRQGFSWSWIKGRALDEIDLPRRFDSVA